MNDSGVNIPDCEPQPKPPQRENEMIMRQNQAREVRGFTLTEVAIVLGIVGLILGAVWVAAAAVYDNMRIKRTNEAILSAAQGFRSLYASANATGVATGTNMTANLVAAGVVPQDMVNGNNGMNPWSAVAGTFTISAIDIAGTQDGFQLNFYNLPQKACVNLLVSNSQNAQGTGLALVGVTAAGTVGTITAAAIAVPPAINPNIAPATTCGAAATNYVRLAYRLKT